MPLSPKYYGAMQPVYPCAIMPTRHCPASYDEGCDEIAERPCARYESADPTPWMPELDGWKPGVSHIQIVSRNESAE